jgi:glycerol-3-phosphate acyltransferase PlsY
VVAVLVTALAAAGAYLLGSVPSGPLLAAARGIDLRAIGSGNIGATNTTRALGRGAGIAVLLADLGKGLLPTLYARAVLGLTAREVACVGLAAFLGHLLPIYLRFRGGKGVATAGGVFLAIAPGSAAFALAVFALVFFKWRIASVASLSAAAVFTLAVTIARTSPVEPLFAAFVLLCLLYTHRGNLVRLLSREERRV